MNKSLIADALESKSWPFEEAKKILKRIGDNKKNIIFETGYGPSGLPHIGTFGEVARTSMVRFALNVLNPDLKKHQYFHYASNWGVLIPSNWAHWGDPPNSHTDELRTSVAFSYATSEQYATIRKIAIEKETPK